jgi:hypothetical protein
MSEKYNFPDEETGSVNVEIEGSNDEFEIDVVDDTPDKDKGRVALNREVTDPTDAEIESYSDKVRGRIKDLTHARHDERRAKEAILREKQELETFAQRILDENKQLKQYANHGAQQYAVNLKSSAETELQVARDKFKSAQESYDADAIISAQEALMDAKTKLENAKNFRPASLQTASDGVQIRKSEPEIAQPDDKTLRWQAKNQWFGAQGNEELTSFSLGLHQKLVNSGVDPRSDEYFERIDARMKATFPEVFGSSSRKPASNVAPATRSTGTKRVQITSSAAALAKKFGLTPQQYAAQVAKLEN